MSDVVKQNDVLKRLGAIFLMAGIEHGQIELLDGRISMEISLTEEEWRSFFKAVVQEAVIDA